MLQLPAEGCGGAAEDQGQVHQEAQGHADPRPDHAHQHSGDQGEAGVHPEGQEPEGDRGDNSEGRRVVILKR